MTTNWREDINTPEAIKALKIIGFPGPHPDTPQEELDNAVKWFANIGIPAYKASLEEAEQRNMSIYDPDF